MPKPPNPFESPPAIIGADRPTRVRWRVLVWLCGAAAIAYICRQSIGVAESTIRDDTGLTKEQMGWVMSGFFWSYALAQIPTGWLGNRIGSRRMLPAVAMLWSVATGAMGLAIGLPILLVSRIANGVAQAGLFPAAVNTVSRWFPAGERATANGALGAFMGVGGVIGTALTGLLLAGLDYTWAFAGLEGHLYLAGLDWQWVFVLYSLLGLAWAWGFYVWFREWPREHPRVNAAELQVIDPHQENHHQSPSQVERLATPWLAMLASPAMWCICGQQFCRAAGQIFFASWFATYLQEARGLSIPESGLLTSLPLAGLVVGGLLGGVVSDWVFRRTGSLAWARKGVAVTCLSACAALVLVALTIDSAGLAVAVISLGSTFAALAAASGYTITIDMGGRHVPTVFGAMNMVGNFGAASFPIVAAWLRVATGNWVAVLVLFAGLYAAAAVFWLLLRPAGTIFEQSLVASGGEPA